MPKVTLFCKVAYNRLKTCKWYKLSPTICPKKHYFIQCTSHLGEALGIQPSEHQGIEFQAIKTKASVQRPSGFQLFEQMIPLSLNFP